MDTPQDHIEIERPQPHRVFLHPLWLRLWHWGNAVLFLALSASGVSLHYAGADTWLISFETARQVHNVAGIAAIVLWLGFLVANAWGGNGRQYLPQLRGLPQRMGTQARYYVVGIFNGDPHPHVSSARSKFNALQQVTYLMVMYVGFPVLALSGVLLLFPEYAPATVWGFGGIWPMAVAHSVTSFGLTLFALGHLYLATTGHTPGANIIGMITGWQEVHELPEIALKPEQQLFEEQEFGRQEPLDANTTA